MDARNVLFMHIPKCAGSAIYDWVQDNIGSDQTVAFAERFMPDLDRLRTIAHGSRFVGGHLLLHDVAKIIPDGGAFLVTLVREPIKQLVSHLQWIDTYNSESRDPEYQAMDLETRRVVDELKKTDFADPGSLDYFLTNLSPKGVFYFDNLQSRYFVAHRVPPIQDYTPLTLNYTIQILKALTCFDYVGSVADVAGVADVLAAQLGFEPKADITLANTSQAVRRIDGSNQMVAGVLRKRLLVDEWLYREITHRLSSQAQSKSAQDEI